MVNVQDDSGVLVGNWSGDYSGGESPLSWTGSAEILAQFAQRKKPVRYAQCWVFSGVQTSCEHIHQSTSRCRLGLTNITLLQYKHTTQHAMFRCIDLPLQCCDVLVCQLAPSPTSTQPTTQSSTEQLIATTPRREKALILETPFGRLTYPTYPTYPQNETLFFLEGTSMCGTRHGCLDLTFLLASVAGRYWMPLLKRRVLREAASDWGPVL